MKLKNNLVIDYQLRRKLFFCALFAVMAMQPIKKGYDRIDPFKNGMAKVYKGDLIGYINLAGVEVISCRYNQISDFVNGLAKVMIEKKYGYISLNDEVIIPIKYDFISPFKNEIAQIGIKDKFGIISKSGEELLPVIYDEISSFSKNGEAKIRLKDKERKIKYSGEGIEFTGEE
jgi:hypothetical protein